MDIGHLEEYVYLAETLSFTQTAKHFYTSRSVISRHLAALENELGVQLLQRSRHNVSLTEGGEALYHGAQTLINDYRQLVNSTQMAGKAVADSLNIGYLRNAARPFIITFVNGLKEHHPKLPLTFTCMDYDELCQAMEDGQINAALAMDFDNRLGSMCRSTFVYRDEFHAVVSTSNPLASKESGLCREDLAGKELVLSKSFMSQAFNDHLMEKLANLSVMPTFVYTDDTDEVKLKLLTEGSIALQSGLNIPLSGEGTRALSFTDVDLSFDVSVYVIRSASKGIVAACKRIASECKAEIEKGWTYTE